MTEEEKARKIEQIYNDAMEKIIKLKAMRKEIVGNFIKDLEAQKINAIKSTLEAKFNQE